MADPVHPGAYVVRRSPLLRALLAQGALFNFFEQALITLYLVVALRTLGMATSAVGMLLGVGAVGSVAGAALAARLSARVRRTDLVALVMGFALIAPCVLPLSPHDSPYLAGAMAALAFLAYGVGLTVYNVHSIAIRHESVEAEYQGRVGAVYRFFAFGGTALGAAFANWLTTWWVPQSAMWIPCAGLLAALLLFVGSLHRIEAAGPASTGPRRAPGLRPDRRCRALVVPLAQRDDQGAQVFRGPSRRPLSGRGVRSAARQHLAHRPDGLPARAFLSLRRARADVRGGDHAGEPQEG